ncbi:MAG TPA: hypothetical protein VFB30_07840 [Spirochaetia bacterium]|nr:hypothetical protein [Spirochaetia bacterium]
MGRAIEQENSFLQVLLKLIPSEVIAVFIFIQGVMPHVLLPHLVIALLLVCITPVYLYWAGGVRSRQQLVISTLSFVVWVYAMGVGPLRFVRPPWYEPWHGAVALALWTLIPPMFLSRAQERGRTSAGKKRVEVSSAGKRAPGAPRRRQEPRGGTRH